MTNDPRLLIEVFADLSQIVQRWTASVTALEDVVLYVSHETTQSVRRILDQVTIVEDLAQDAHNVARQAIYVAEKAQDSANHARVGSSSAMENSAKIKSAAQAMQVRWSESKVKAQRFLDQAQNNLKIAYDQLNAEIRNLNAANNQLTNAQHALSICQTSYHVNKDGKRIYRSCWAEQSRVNSAANHAQQCAANVRSAENKVSAMRNEVQRCQIIFDQCHAGVTVAQTITSASSANLGVAAESQTAAARADAESHEAKQLADDTMSQATQLLLDVGHARKVAFDIESRIVILPDAVSKSRDAGERQRDIQSESRAMLIELEERLLQFNAVTGDVVL